MTAAANAPLSGRGKAAMAEAFALLRRGDADAAGHIAAELRSQSPGHPEIDYLCAEIASARGDTEAAIVSLQSALLAAPGQWVLLVKLARLLLGQRRRAAFRAVLAEAAAVADGDPEAAFLIARAYLAADQPADALPLLMRAAATPAGSRHPALLHDLATSQFFLGHVEAAEASVRSALALAPLFPAAIHLRSTLRRQSAGSNHVDDLRRRLEVASDPEARVAVLFALAKELEDLGEHEASFEALSEGAALRSTRAGSEVVGEIDTMARIARCHTAEALAAMGEGTAGDGPIFIVGMPRSGTTLLERMLGRLPGVAAAGELLDLKLAVGDGARAGQRRNPECDLVEAILRTPARDLGAGYLRGASEAVASCRWWLDKTPVNFQYIGLIRQCIPGARILHVTRAPMDACFAVYKTLFGQAYPFSYHLETLADFYIAYRRLMAHWHLEFPGAVLDVAYEAMVSDTEGQARRVLAHCGFPWDPAVLRPEENAAPSSTASAAQVREPIHARSVGAWQRHALALEPLRVRLEAAGLVDAHGNPV